MNLCANEYVKCAGDKIAFQKIGRNGEERCKPSGLVALPDDEVHVWRIQLSEWQPYGQDLERVLLEPERSRARGFCFRSDFSCFVVTRSLLRYILGQRYLDADPRALVFETGAHGKPRLQQAPGNQPLFFNVAHSGDFSLVAVARREVGVDIERVRADLAWEDLIRRVFSEAEQDALANTPPDQRRSCFFTTWTRKEAYLKARGDGLFVQPRECSVFVGVESSPGFQDVPFDPQETARWLMRDVPVGPGYVAAVAARKPDWKLQTIEAEPKADFACGILTSERGSHEQRGGVC